jgi:hypothetical protein
LLALLSFGFSFAVSLALALAIATVITVAIAYALHGGITALVMRWDDPQLSYDRLKKYFILPAFVLMILSIIAYVAIQRLDPETLYFLQPVFSSSKFTAMLGFMVFGTALLVASDLLNWSLVRAARYEALKDERQKIVSKRREWQEELDEVEETQGTSANQPPTSPSTNQEALPNQPAASLNGNSASVSQGAAKVLPAALILAGVLGLSSCSTPPQVKTTFVQEKLTCNVVIDATGPPNDEPVPQQAREQALRKTGLALLNNMPGIIEQQRVGKLSVFWFGSNGWNAENKLTLDLPPSRRVEIVKHNAGEIEKVRPDVGDFDKQRNEKALAEAEKQAQSEYRKEIREKLASLTIDVLVPPATVESRCSDLNNTLSRFTQHSAQEVRQIVLLVTDGRQNCEGEDEIMPISFAEKDMAVIVLLIPGMDSDGREDYDVRRARFTEACPQCVVVPYYREDLEHLVAEALKKTSVVNETARN